MTRKARLVVPGSPHHVTQRGNRRQKTFFSHSDYGLYLESLAESCRQYDLDIWAYCLMPNHIHLIAVPQTADSLATGIGRAHSRYSLIINFREDWKGHLWQGRFASFVMDAEHLVRAARYIELNPIRAGLTDRADKWPYSSAAAHMYGQEDPLIKTAPLLDMVPNWSEWLSTEVDQQDLDNFRLHTRTGRPLGNDDFVSALEATTGHILKRQKPGPK